MGERRRLMTASAVVLVLAVVSGGFVLVRALRSDPPAGPWHTALWSTWTAASIDDACTVGVCVAGTVVLPLGSPVESVVDLPMPEELGALTVERAWIGERAGMFGPGWASVWDVRLVDGKFVGPLPAEPIEPPRRGHRVALDDGGTVQVDAHGRLDEVCLDASVCTAAEWSDDALLLRPMLESPEGSGDDELAEVELTIDDGLVTSAETSDGRTVGYEYTAGRLSSVAQGDDRTRYGYEEGRLASIDDGVQRVFTYDRAGRVRSATDLDGGRWTVTPVRVPESSGSSARAAGASDRAFEVESPEGWVRTYRFSRGLLVEAVDDEEGLLLRRELDASGVRVEERPLEGMRSERVANDRLVAEQRSDDGLTRRVQYRFDEHGRTTRTETAEGTTKISYEGRSGRPAEVSGPNGTQTFDYDRHGLLTATEDADGYRVEIERDDAGQPTEIGDGVRRTEFAYDAAGRVDRQRTGDDVTTASYLPHGLLRSISTPGGEESTASYDDFARLESLGTATASPRADLSTATATADGPAVEVVERRDGRLEHRYPNGETVVFDDAGRPTHVIVGNRTETRRYDEEGRLAELALPGGPTYELTYTEAGRIESIDDGATAAELTWHGDLIIEVETTAGNTYTYTYDEAGRVATASVGPLHWDYDYDEGGRSSVVRGPSGVTRTRWDGLGRPIDVRDGGRTERYRWEGDGLDLAQVDVDGDVRLKLERNDTGDVETVTGPEAGRAEFGYDPDTGELGRFRIGDAAEVTVSYDDDGRIDTIESSDRAETWTWADGQVVEVLVDGEDDPHRLDWLAPGLLGEVLQGDEQIFGAEVDAAGRPIELVTDGEVAATLAWDDFGLTEASIVDGATATFERDDEDRLIEAEVGDRRLDWTYEAGALTRLVDGERSTRFEYDDGRLQRTIHQIADSESIIDWNRSGAGPAKITTPRGDVAFTYDKSKVQAIELEGTEQRVRYEDDQATADSDAGELLDALFSASGHYLTPGGQATVGPHVPWIQALPAEFGVSLPEVVTGRTVVEAAIAEQLPATPGFLVDDPNDLARRTAHGLIAATAEAPVLTGPDRVGPLRLEFERRDFTVDFAGAIDALAIERVATALAPAPGLLERVVDFGQDLFSTVTGGITGGLRAVQRFLTQNVVGRFVLTAGFMATTYLVVGICAASVVCAVAATTGLLVGEALLTAEPGQSLVSAVSAAVLRPYGDLARAIGSGDPLAIVLSGATTTAAVASIALPAIRQLQPQALAAACGMTRMVCISMADYGEAALHVADAQRHGAPRFLTLDRTGATGRRASALRGLPARAGFDRDEYPFALSSRRAALSIRYLDPTSNRSLGAYVGNQLRVLPDGAWFYVQPIA